VKLGEPVWLVWQFSNTSSQELQFLVWGTPFDENWFAPYVRVQRDGTPLNYGGAMLKRGDPPAGQYLSLAPGAHREARVELGVAFDLRATGRYRVQPQIALHDLIRGGSALAPRPLSQHVRAALACKAVEFEVFRQLPATSP